MRMRIGVSIESVGYENKELQSSWSRKLGANGYDDLESPYGQLRGEKESHVTCVLIPTAPDWPDLNSATSTIPPSFHPNIPPSASILSLTISPIQHRFLEDLLKDIASHQHGIYILFSHSGPRNSTTPILLAPRGIYGGDYMRLSYRRRL